MTSCGKQTELGRETLSGCRSEKWASCLIGRRFPTFSNTRAYKWRLNYGLERNKSFWAGNYPNGSRNLKMTVQVEVWGIKKTWSRQNRQAVVARVQRFWTWAWIWQWQKWGKIRNGGSWDNSLVDWPDSVTLFPLTRRWWRSKGVFRSLELGELRL